MECKFCLKECKNDNSLKQHQIRCKSNPDKINIVSNFIKYHKKIKDGIIEKKYFNQYDKAKKLGLNKPLISNETREKLKIAGSKGGGRGGTFEKELLRKKRISEFLLGNQRSKGRGTKILYKNFHLRSTWEYKVAVYLDELEINWDYEVRCFKLSNNRTYRPDFFIYNEQNELIKIIEVKGYWFKDNKQKFEDFKVEYEISIELWDKEKLISLNLL